jgi:hypothetical protein
MEHKLVDIAQIAFLEILREIVTIAGAPLTKGTLIRLSTNAGKRLKPMDFATFDDFVASSASAANPVAAIEGPARYYGDGLFGLNVCPFAPTIAGYRSVFETLPESFATVTAEYNRPGPGTDPIFVGNGAGVSPFCAVHQPLRATAAKRVSVSGHTLDVYQLGCKSATGHIGIARRWLENGPWSESKVEDILNNNMCCYGIKLTPEVAP